MDKARYFLYFSIMKKDIPLYDLYGEDQRRTEPGPVHIEAIRDRSKAHGWHIKPHRHSHLLQILHVETGLLQARFDDHVYGNKNHCSFLIPTGVVHEFTFSPQSQGDVISISLDSLATQSNLDCSYLQQLNFTQCTWHPDDSLHSRVNLLINELRQELREDSHNNSLCLLINLIIESIVRQSNKQLLQHTPEQTLIKRFDTLVERDYTLHRKVNDYAIELGVSYPTLNRSCLKQMGIAPKEHLNNKILQEAKRKLMYTTQTIDQISYSLGFKDPAYFNRFFKKLTHQTPGEYRQQSAY